MDYEITNATSWCLIVAETRVVERKIALAYQGFTHDDLTITNQEHEIEL